MWEGIESLITDGKTDFHMKRKLKKKKGKSPLFSYQNLKYTFPDVSSFHRTLIVLYKSVEWKGK